MDWKALLLLLAVIAGWVLLMGVILPRAGVET